MRIAVCPVVLVAAASLYSQTPAFEVASVKPSNPNGGRMEINGFYTYPGGRIVCRGCTLEYLLMEAFDVQSFQIAGGPAWLQSDRFELEARPPATSKSVNANPMSPKAPPNAEQRQMVQALLADRFQLKSHRDTKHGTVYLLFRGSKPLRLEQPKVKSDFEFAGFVDGGIAGESVSMPTLASRLSRYLDAPVLDKTAIAGQFDFKFVYAQSDYSDLTSAILAAMQDIDLKLESSKGPVQTIMIDSAAKPSAN